MRAWIWDKLGLASTIIGRFSVVGLRIMAALQRRHDPLYTIILSQLTNIRTLIRAAMRCLFARYLSRFSCFCLVRCLICATIR
jgi:hypothetical protein